MKIRFAFTTTTDRTHRIHKGDLMVEHECRECGRIYQAESAAEACEQVDTGTEFYEGDD